MAKFKVIFLLDVADVETLAEARSYAEEIAREEMMTTSEPMAVVCVEMVE